MTSQTIANSRSFKEVQSQKMLPTAHKDARRISEVEGENHMATQKNLIPSEKSLHSGELQVETSGSKEPMDPAPEAKFKTGFLIHDPML